MKPMLLSNFKFAIDTCSLTELTRTYPQDVFPTVWDKVDDLITHGLICSSEEVYIEIIAQDDILAEWVKQRRHIFLPIDINTQKYVKRILASHPTLLDLKKNKSGADPFLIAVAMIHHCAVVTQERPSGGTQKAKIPDVCKAYGLECITVLEMLRKEGLRL